MIRRLQNLVVEEVDNTYTDMKFPRIPVNNKLSLFSLFAFLSAAFKIPAPDIAKMIVAILRPD